MATNSAVHDTLADWSNDFQRQAPAIRAHVPGSPTAVRGREISAPRVSRRTGIGRRQR
jgi:hypothetical protein